MWIAFSIGTLFALIAVVSIILVFDGFPLTDAFYVFAFTGAIAAVCFGIVYAGYSTAKRGPTDKAPGQDSESKSMSESWQEGAERGERIGEKLDAAILWPFRAAQSVIPTVKVSSPAFPSWAWTVGVVVGCLLSVSVWPTALAEKDAGMAIGIFGGGLALLVSVAMDARRLNRDPDSDFAFRWWAYALPSAVPLFGWVFGVLWLARKFQKTGSIA
jgi:hypothetical protein